jgi:hypothetical protein
VRDGESPDAPTPPGIVGGGGGGQPPDDSRNLARGEEGVGTASGATSNETLAAIAELLVLKTYWIQGEGTEPLIEAIATLAQLQAGSQGATPSELELAIDRVLAAGELMLAYNDNVAAADRVLAARDAIKQGRFAEAQETVDEVTSAHN